MNKQKRVGAFLSEYACLVFLFVLLASAGLLSDKFFTFANLQNLFKQMSILAVLGVGMGLVLMSGCIDLTVGANMAVAALITIVFQERIGIFPAIMLAIAASVLISCVNMLIVYLTKARAMEIMMITFGMKLVYRGIAQAVTGNVVYKYSGKGDFAVFGKGLLFGKIPVIGLIMLGVLIVMGIMLSRMKFGRKVVCVGVNPEAARLAGISVTKTRLFCFIIAGICCGIAGVLLASRTGSVKALSGDDWEMNAVCAIAIGGYSMAGGFGSAWRCFVGALTFTVLGNVLNLVGANAYLQTVVQGTVLVLAVWVDSYFRVKKGGNSR